MKQFIRIAAILALGFGFTVGSVLAKDDHDTKPKVSGEISNVNAAAQTFQIKDQNEQMMTFKANPATEFELKKSSKLSWDKDGTFSDLKVGQWVKVEYYGVGEIKMADEVDIYSAPAK